MRKQVVTQAVRHGDQWRFWVCLLGFVAAGPTFRLAMAIVWPAFERPDEVFQNLEPAYRLWTGRGIVTWEWRKGIRSFVFPAAMAGVMQLTSWLHLPEAAAVPAIWAGLALLSSGVFAIGVTFGWRRYGIAGAIPCGVVTAFWPDLVYYGRRPWACSGSGKLRCSL